MERLKLAWIGISRAGVVCLLLLTGYLFQKEDTELLTLVICFLVWSNFAALNFLVKHLFDKNKPISNQSSNRKEQIETDNDQNKGNKEKDELDIPDLGIPEVDTPVKEKDCSEENRASDVEAERVATSKDEYRRKTEVRVSLNTEILDKKQWGLGETDAIGYWRNGMGKFFIIDNRELMPCDLKTGTLVNDDINRIIKGQQIEKLFELINMDSGDKIVRIKPARIQVKGENIYLSEKGRIEAE